MTNQAQPDEKGSPPVVLIQLEITIDGSPPSSRLTKIHALMIANPDDRPDGPIDYMHMGSCPFSDVGDAVAGIVDHLTERKGFDHEYE